MAVNSAWSNLRLLRACALLSGTSVAPAQLDEFFCAGEAHLRAEELEELGYKEEWIWGDEP